MRAKAGRCEGTPRQRNTLTQDLPVVNGSRGRITIYCVAETLNRDLLTKKLRERGPQFLLHSYPDVLYGRYHKCGAAFVQG